MEILIRTFLNNFFGKAVQDKELSRRLEMSSLSIYNTFNISPGKIGEQILKNSLSFSK
jgi:hypothetical protein